MSVCVFYFGFILQSTNIRWTGDWLQWAGGPSRGYSSLLPSDHWDRLQYHLSLWSGINRMTETEWPDTCMEEIHGQLSGSLSVMESEKGICFLSMAQYDDYAPGVIYGSIGHWTTEANKKQERNFGSIPGALLLHIKWSAGQSITDHWPKQHWLNILNQPGKMLTRTESVDSVKQNEMGGDAAYQNHNSEAGWAVDAMLAQRWWDQLRIWKQELFIDLSALNSSQSHSSFSFNFLPFSLYSLYKPPLLPPGLRMKKCMGMTPFTEDERLGMSHAQREPSTQALYVAVWRAAPSPLCSSSTPQRLPFSLGRAEGEVGPLLLGGILRGDCKGCDCVGLYFCGEEEGGEEREGAGERETEGSRRGEFGHRQPC